MSEEKRRESAGRVASAIALPEWSLRRKLALALLIPMLLAATFGGLRVQSALSESDNYSATAKQVTVLRPVIDYLAAAEKAVITARVTATEGGSSELKPAIDDVNAKANALKSTARSADLNTAQQAAYDDIIAISEPLLAVGGYASDIKAAAQVRQVARAAVQLTDAIIAAQLDPEPRLSLLQSVMDGRLSLSMQLWQVAVPKDQINTVDLAAELGLEAATLDRLSAGLGEEAETTLLSLNQLNGKRFVVVRSGNLEFTDAGAFEPYDALSTQLLDDIDRNLTSAASDARATAIANAVVTLALLVAAIFLALLVSRMLLNPIRRVREGALEIANDRLPAMVARIRAGEDPGEITPIPVTTHEEMGQLARAVDDMNRQAVSLASGEARLRTQVGEMFSTLSRRNTSLINQQLGLIERLEKDEEDPNRLESLFRLDHLASRMRRTADSLMVLADAPVQSSDTDALALGDVFQAAMAGVQEYQRVQIEAAPAEKVNGVAAADVVHLMTELVDNALAFSPPTAPVKITTKQAGDSTVVEISDGGLGIAPDVLTSLNEDLRSGGEVTVETARRMGLLVVSRLAKRHGITVSLARNTRGGTTATVLLPPALLRGRPAQPQVKQRPGLSSLQTPKPATAAPAGVTELVTNERSPQPAPEAPQAPAAPATPAAFQRPAPATPAAPAAPEPAAPAAKAGKPEVEVDSIAAAINAVTRLPQRSPGATRTGAAMPGAPVASTGGSLFQRLQAKKAEEESEQAQAADSAPGLPQRAPASPTSAFETISADQTNAADATDATDATDAAGEPAAEDGLDLAPASSEALQEDAEQRAGTTLNEVSAPIEGAPAAPGLPRRNGFSNFHALNRAGAQNGHGQNGNGQVASNGAEPLEPVTASEPEQPVEPEQPAEPEQPVEPERAERPLEGHQPVDAPIATSAEGWLATAGTAPAAPPAAEPVYDLLDSRSPMPEPTDDETPIFRILRSNWFTSGTAEGSWSTSEIEAGWEAAEQVAEAPAVQLSQSGLPMRRPGKRLVPGGVSPAAATVTRDPEAIRARLAAHAAGVSRGRTAAVDKSDPAPNTEEGPA